VDGATKYTMVERFRFQRGADYPGQATVIFFTTGQNRRNAPPADPPRAPVHYMKAELNSPMVRLEPSESYEGRFELRYLLPAEYVVEVRMSGFRPERNAGITLRIGQLASVDFKLELGSVNEAVEVSSQGVLLDTQSATMAATVSQERIVDLPLNGRSYVSLGNLTPGVVASGTSFAANARA
jgi:hypothetical protein